MKFDKNEMVGKHILVGIAYRNAEGKVERVVMNHGTVVGTSGATVEYLPRGEEKTVTIPYNPSFFEAGDPDAVYTLASTGEEVTNVDIVAKFEVRKAKEQQA